MKKLLQNFILMLAAAMFLTACSEGDERRHPLYIKALQDRQDGNGQDAAEKLSELLKRRPRSIYTHKLLASVYDEMLNDPIAAVYHYKAYLQAMPEASDAEEVKAWLQQAEKRCYEDLNQRFGPKAASPENPSPEPPVAPSETLSTDPPAEPDSNAENITGSSKEKTEPAAVDAPQAENALIAAKDAEIAELKNKLEQYKVRYNSMRNEVERVRKQRKNTAAKANQVPADLPQTVGETTRYKVVAGDTPGGIARKVYGKSSLYYVILQANPQTDARKLRPGMILNIPKIGKNTAQGNNQ